MSAEPAVGSESGSSLRAYLELGKLRLSFLAVFAVLAGAWMGTTEPMPGSALAGCLVGTLLVAIGGSALNMFIERDHDRLMPRTVSRPLPTGRLAPRTVLVFGCASGLLGTALLAVTTNALATGLCAMILVTYVMVYTPLKRRTHLNTLVGAIPGGLPPVVGYAAGAGEVDQKALILFLILFFWQIPHFLAIAWRYREDYRRGGMQMLPVVDPEGRSTSRQMVVYTLALVAVSAIAHPAGLAGQLYLIAALFLGIVFLVPVVIAAVVRKESAMRMSFLVSIIYLPLLLIVMAIDKSA